ANPSHRKKTTHCLRWGGRLRCRYRSLTAGPRKPATNDNLPYSESMRDPSCSFPLRRVSAMAVWMSVPVRGAFVSALGSSRRCPLWPEADIDVMLARVGRVLAKGSSDTAHDDTRISSCLRIGTFSD